MNEFRVPDEEVGGAVYAKDSLVSGVSVTHAKGWEGADDWKSGVGT